MNKDQRKYLSDWVTKGFQKEEKEIKDRRFDRPDLNNYLVAAALQGDLKMQPSESIIAKIRDRLVDSGKDGILVTFESSSRRRHWNDDSEDLDGKHKVTLVAEDVFIVPAEYEQKLVDWRANEEQIAADLKRLEGIKETVMLKVNIGSDKALEDVISQADSLATLDLVNRKLTAGNQTNEITDGAVAGKRSK